MHILARNSWGSTLMYLASRCLPGLGRSLLTGVFWSVFPVNIFGTTRTKNINYEVAIKNASEADT